MLFLQSILFSRLRIQHLCRLMLKFTPSPQTGIEIFFFFSKKRIL